MEATRLAPNIWSDIYRAIQSEVGNREVFQGVVSERDKTKRVVWVQELSTEPIEVVGQGHDITYFSGSTRKVMRVPPAVPDIGDVVVLLRTANDQYKCMGVLSSTTKWSADPALGLIPPDSITAREIAADAVGSSEIAADAVGASEIAPNAVGLSELADGAVDTAAFAASAKAPDADKLDGLDSTEYGYKVYDAMAANDNATSFTVPWPSWASSLRVHIEAVGSETDASGWQTLMGQINGSGSLVYYEEDWGPAGLTRKNAQAAWRLGHIVPGGVDGAIMCPAQMVINRQPVVSACVPTYLSFCSLWIAGTGFDNHNFGGMYYDANIVPSSFVISLVNSAITLNKKFKTGSRVRGWGMP